MFGATPEKRIEQSWAGHWSFPIKGSAADVNAARLRLRAADGPSTPFGDLPSQTQSGIDGPHGV